MKIGHQKHIKPEILIVSIRIGHGSDQIERFSSYEDLILKSSFLFMQ